MEDHDILEEHVLRDESVNIHDLTIQWEAHGAGIEDAVSVSDIHVALVQVVDENAILALKVAAAHVIIVVSVIILQVHAVVIVVFVLSVAVNVDIATIILVSAIVLVVSLARIVRAAVR